MTQVGQGLNKTGVQFGTGQGADSQSGTVVNCDNPDCVDCQINYMFCNQCNANTYLHIGCCYTVANLPVRVGVDINNNQTVSCYDSNCLDCKADYMICIECDAGTFLFHQGCPTAHFLPSGFGPDATTRTGVPCKSAGCDNCKSDYQLCTMCGPTTFLYNMVCYTLATLPAGIGLDMAHGQTASCQDPNCLNCRADYQVCLQCGSTTYLLNSICYASTSLPPGYGANIASQQAVACHSSNCLSCQENYLFCIRCNASYYLYNGACYTESTIPVGAGLDAAQNVIVPCEDSRCISCRSNYQLCRACDPA